MRRSLEESKFVRGVIRSTAKEWFDFVLFETFDGRALAEIRVEVHSLESHLGHEKARPAKNVVAYLVLAPERSSWSNNGG